MTSKNSVFSNCDSDHTALMIIDLQKDFLSAYGRLPVKQSQVPGLVEATNSAIAEARQKEIVIYHIINAFPKKSIANWFRKFAAIKGSEGAEIDGRIDSKDTVCMEKWANDAFCNAELEKDLAAKNIKHIVVAGVYANGCVKATVRGARSRNYQVSVLADAVAAGSEKSVARGLRSCAKLGAEIINLKIPKEV